MAVLTQYNSHTVIEHIQRAWSFLRGELGEMVDVLPAHQRGGDEDWYRGTADSIYQNLDILVPPSSPPKYVVVMAGDHIYKMDYAVLLREHVAHGRGCTVACTEVTRSEARTLGVLSIDANLKIKSISENPDEPLEITGRPGRSLASMGIYVFDTNYLVELLGKSHADPYSSHDFGLDIIPRALDQGRAVAHPFVRSCVNRGEAGSTPYWRPVDTLDSFLTANLDLAAVVPDLDLYDPSWPIWTDQRQFPPAKFVLDMNGEPGLIVNSLVSGGSVVIGSTIKDCVVFSGVRVKSFSDILECVLLPGATIGQNCRLRRVIVGNDCVLPDGLVVGYDPIYDTAHFETTAAGTVLITKEMLSSLT